jgi:single-stranded DNA-binding protein
MSASTPSDVSAHESVNEVVLRGRLSADPDERVLPSGDRIVTWRLIVQRPNSRRPSRVATRSSSQ